MPEDERAEYAKPEFLENAAALDPIDWLPKVQAANFAFRMLSLSPVAKEKQRAAVPANATVVIYKTPEEFNAVVRGKRDLEWIQRELRSSPDGSS